VPRDVPTNGSIEILGAGSRFAAFDLSPRAAPLRLSSDLRNIMVDPSFLLAVVTIVSIATFRMPARLFDFARVENRSRELQRASFSGADSYDYIMDRIITSKPKPRFSPAETLALQTIRSTGLAAIPSIRLAMALPKLSASAVSAIIKRLRNSAHFFESQRRRRSHSRLLDVTFESTDPQLAARVVMRISADFSRSNFSKPVPRRLLKPLPGCRSA